MLFINISGNNSLSGAFIERDASNFPFSSGKGLTRGMKGAYNELTCQNQGKYAKLEEVIVWNEARDD
jgi:hypothetical protein